MAKIRLQLAKGDKGMPTIVFHVDNLDDDEDRLITRYLRDLSRQPGSVFDFYEHIPPTPQDSGMYRISFPTADAAETFAEYLIANDINSETPILGFTLSTAIRRFDEIAAKRSL